MPKQCLSTDQAMLVDAPHPHPHPKDNPLPSTATPTEAGRDVRQDRKPSWQKVLAPDVVKATKEIRAFWPSPQQEAFQPDGKTLVPGVSLAELAGRLAEIKTTGADLDICVAIAKRAVEEWRAGKWIKAPQHFFGKSKDAPFRDYYQTHVTNAAMRVTS
jgi:hypothetical protein